MFAPYFYSFRHQKWQLGKCSSMEMLPHRTQDMTPLSQQEIQPSLGPRHAPSMRAPSHLADSFHSIWSPSCCRVSISVKRVGLGASSSSPRMSCSCSAAGDPEKMKELGLPSAQQKAGRPKAHRIGAGTLVREGYLSIL